LAKQKEKQRMNIKQIDKEISRHTKEAVKLRIEKDLIFKRKLILCMHCQKRTKLSSLIFVQDHAYIEPYSCNGGDFWIKCDSQSYFICPKCDAERANRMCVHKQGKFLLKHKHLFRTIWERHDYGWPHGIDIKKPGDKK